MESLKQGRQFEQYQDKIRERKSLREQVDLVTEGFTPFTEHLGVYKNFVDDHPLTVPLFKTIEGNDISFNTTLKRIGRPLGLGQYLGMKFLDSSDAVVVGYVTYQGRFRPFGELNDKATWSIEEATIGKHGCPPIPTNVYLIDVSGTKLKDWDMKSTKMKPGSACGYEGTNVYYDSSHVGYVDATGRLHPYSSSMYTLSTTNYDVAYDTDMVGGNLGTLQTTEDAAKTACNSSTSCIGYTASAQGYQPKSMTGNYASVPGTTLMMRQPILTGCDACSNNICDMYNITKSHYDAYDLSNNQWSFPLKSSTPYPFATKPFSDLVVSALDQDLKEGYTTMQGREEDTHLLVVSESYRYTFWTILAVLTLIVAVSVMRK